MALPFTFTKRVIVKGYTVHAFVNVNGNAIRPPVWLVEAFYKAIAEKKLGQK